MTARLCLPAIAAGLLLCGPSAAQGPITPSGPPSSQGAPVPGSNQGQAADDKKAAAPDAPVLNASKPPQDQEAGRNRANAQDGVGAGEHQPASNEEKLVNLTFWLVIGTLILMTATIGLWWETRKLARQAKVASEDTKAALATSQASLDLAASNANKEFRAYVRLSIASGTVEIGKNPAFNVQATNYGRTPANDVSFFGALVVRASGWKWPANQDDIEGAMPSAIIHPGDLGFIVALVCDGELTDYVYSSIKSGHSCVYGRGTLSYTDVFGKKHSSSISFEFSGPECFARRNPRFALAGNSAT